MKKINLRKLFRNFIKLFSFTTALFIFQACYGTPNDMRYFDDILISGQVVSETDKLPIKGIKVELDSLHNYGKTDENGEFHFWVSKGSFSSDSVLMHFKDIDSIDNGWYKDSSILVRILEKEIKINIALKNAQ